MNKEFVVILSNGCCLIIEMTDERYKDKRENYDDDWSVYVEVALSEELEQLPSSMQWAVVKNGDFYYNATRPIMGKLK